MWDGICFDMKATPTLSVGLDIHRTWWKERGAGSKFGADERGVTWGGPGMTLRVDAALVEPIQGIQELVAKSPYAQMARSYSPRKLLPGTTG